MSRIQINNLSKNSMQELKQENQELDNVRGGCGISTNINLTSRLSFGVGY